MRELSSRISSLNQQISAAIPRTGENVEALELGKEILERRKRLEEASSGQSATAARFQVANLLEDGND